MCEQDREGKVKQQQALTKPSTISAPADFVFILDFKLKTAAKNREKVSVAIYIHFGLEPIHECRAQHPHTEKSNGQRGRAEQKLESHFSFHISKNSVATK